VISICQFAQYSVWRANAAAMSRQSKAICEPEAGRLHPLASLRLAELASVYQADVIHRAVRRDAKRLA
jgi:hypothetical protein